MSFVVENTHALRCATPSPPTPLRAPPHPSPPPLLKLPLRPSPWHPPTPGGSWSQDGPPEAQVPDLPCLRDALHRRGRVLDGGLRRLFTPVALAHAPAPERSRALQGAAGRCGASRRERGTARSGIPRAHAARVHAARLLLSSGSQNLRGIVRGQPHARARARTTSTGTAGRAISKCNMQPAPNSKTEAAPPTRGASLLGQHSVPRAPQSSACALFPPGPL